MARLGDVFTITSGGTPDKKKSAYYTNGTIPWVKTGDLKDRYVSTDVECITEEGLNNSSAKLFPPKTVLVAMYGATIGACSILPYEAATNQACAAFLPKENILPTYLYYFLSSKKAQFIKDGVGGAQPNISAGYLKNVEFQVISIEQQFEIVARLNKVYELIALRKEQLAKLDQLLKSRFIELFGDPVYNSVGLPTKKLSELGSLDRGKSQHRPRNDPKLLGGPYPLIQTGEVASAGLYITDYKNTYSELGLRQSKMWKAGTLCITIAANIAQTAILAFDACFPDSVVGFVPNKSISAVYMHYWFGFFQKILEEQAPQVAQKNINLKILSELDVMVPPVELQDKFIAFVEQTDKSKLEIQQSLDKLELLKKSLMQEYFG